MMAFAEYNQSSHLVHCYAASLGTVMPPPNTAESHCRICVGNSGRIILAAGGPELYRFIIDGMAEVVARQK